MIQIGAFALFGIYALNALVQRYAEGPLAWWSYLLLIAGAAGAFMPGALFFNIAGAVLVVAVVVLSRKGKLSAEPAVVASAAT